MSSRAERPARGPGEALAVTGRRAAVEAVTAALVALMSTAGVVPARAQQAPADTAVGGYFKVLSDSTDAFFGRTAAPTDTAGLDSARAYGLAHPYVNALRPSRHFGVFPVFSFNRVDGPVWGGGATIGRATGLARLKGELEYASGPNRWLGQARLTKSIERGEATWQGELGGGRITGTLDRERSDTRLAAVRALLNGSDRRHYDQREGVWASIAREGAVLRLGASYRDMLESPRVTTATWNLLHNTPEIVFNQPAARGRASEIELEALWRVPGTPARIEAHEVVADPKLGGDFSYRRSRVVTGADIGLGRNLALLPQAEYGALFHQWIPQEAFYLGGSHTLRSVPGEERGGSRIALGRMELITVRDVLAMMRLPHPRAFPIQAGVFGGVGAVWGYDPFGGPQRLGNAWPHRGAWRQEVGFSLLNQPGIPDPTELLRLDVAFPLGPVNKSPRITIGYSRALDLLRPFERN